MEKQVEIEESKGKNKGFTLIELLIVIVILGILAAVTVFAVRGITDKGTTSACASDKATVATAAEAYFAQYGGTAIQTDGKALPGQTVILASATAGDYYGTLVNAGYLRSPSTKYTISADGKTLTGVSPCV